MLDYQSVPPNIHVSLSRVGVRDMEKIIRLRHDGEESLFYSRLNLFVDLSPGQMGVHMSRFDQCVTEIIEELVREEGMDIESLVEKMARLVLIRQQAVRSEISISAKYPAERITPVSGQKTQQIYTLIGMAVSTRKRTKKLIGVEVTGLTVCPCAQTMVREKAERTLEQAGFSRDEIGRIFRMIPLPSHNQRGKATLMIGSEERIDARRLVAIVEEAFSSEVYDLLKRPDELFVVEKAHRRPRFVEDSVREMLWRVIEDFSYLADDSFVLAKQENFEGTHHYSVFAERSGTLAEIKEELWGNQYLLRHTTVQEWLNG